MKQPWNVKCIIQLQPKRPWLPSRGAQVLPVSEMEVQALRVGSLKSFAVSVFPLTLPPSWLFVSLPPTLSVSPTPIPYQSVHLAESGSPTVSHFWLLLFAHHRLSNSLPPTLFFSLSISLSLLLSPSPFVSASLPSSSFSRS